MRLLEHARSDEGRKQLRYAGVSLSFVPVSIAMILVLAGLLRSPGGQRQYALASALTTAILAIPTLLAYRRWVWQATSLDRVRLQVAVFWVASVLGAIVATTLTAVVQRLSRGQSYPVQATTVLVAQGCGYGLVWIARYLILDKWLFRVFEAAGSGPKRTEEVS